MGCEKLPELADRGREPYFRDPDYMWPDKISIPPLFPDDDCDCHDTLKRHEKREKDVLEFLESDGGRPAIGWDEIKDFIALDPEDAEERLPAWLDKVAPRLPDDDRVLMIGHKGVIRSQVRRWLKFRMFQVSSRGYAKAKEERWVSFRDRQATQADIVHDALKGTVYDDFTYDFWLEGVRTKYKEHKFFFKSFLDREKRKAISTGHLWPGITSEEWSNVTSDSFEVDVENPHFAEFVALHSMREKGPGGCPGLLLKGGKYSNDASTVTNALQEDRRRTWLDYVHDIINVVSSHNNRSGDLQPFIPLPCDFKRDVGEQDIRATFVEYVAYECLYLEWLQHWLYLVVKLDPSNDVLKPEENDSLQENLKQNIVMQEGIRNWAVAELNKMREETIAGKLNQNDVKKRPGTKGPIKTLPNFLNTAPTPTKPGWLKRSTATGGRQSARLRGRRPEFAGLEDIPKKRPKKPQIWKVTKPSKPSAPMIYEKIDPKFMPPESPELSPRTSDLACFDIINSTGKKRGRPPKGSRTAHPKP